MGESESDMDDGGAKLVDICLKAEQVPPSLAKVHTVCHMLLTVIVLYNTFSIEKSFVGWRR